MEGLIRKYEPKASEPSNSYKSGVRASTLLLVASWKASYETKDFHSVNAMSQIFNAIRYMKNRIYVLDYNFQKEKINKNTTKKKGKIKHLKVRSPYYVSLANQSH